jgi:hypothetical protein
MSNVVSCGFNYASPGKVGGLGTALKVFPSLVLATAPAILSIPTQLAGTQLVVKATGYVLGHGATCLANFAIQSGTSLTYSANTTLFTLASNTAVTQSTAVPFAIRLPLNWDLVSGIVQTGGGTSYLNGALVTSTTTGSGVLLSGVTGNLSLVFAALFTVTDALNAAYLTEWEVSA